MATQTKCYTIAMRTTVTRRQTAFRLRTDLLEKLQRMAAEDNRSLNSFVECALMDMAFHEPNAETLAAMEEVRSGKCTVADMTSILRSGRRACWASRQRARPVSA